uniref:Uncharacterized protein n=1 Tax=Nelumbo nucifera TaxID=4432 RepID=A0A822XS65_NELNU|nr:TPA_asm: hypothetical protein HUJ06_024640 [Nelumbo nucifera]
MDSSQHSPVQCVSKDEDAHVYRNVDSPISTGSTCRRQHNRPKSTACSVTKCCRLWSLGIPYPVTLSYVRHPECRRIAVNTHQHSVYLKMHLFVGMSTHQSPLDQRVDDNITVQNPPPAQPSTVAAFEAWVSCIPPLQNRQPLLQIVKTLGYC